MGKRRVSRSEDKWDDQDEALLSSISDSDDWVGSRKKLRGPGRSALHKSTIKKRKTEEHIREPATIQGAPAVRDSDHPKSRHSIRSLGPLRAELLQWYATVHDSRGMPWRKPSSISQGSEECAQRAYEVWVSEVMLQQIQVATVIPYYNRWMETFPTLGDLAKANVDQVNTLWKGLGYYSRASRLLEGAKKAVKEYGGRLPDNAKEMQANIPGIGRYSAGAICSIAYGERVPVLDGNVHRLLSRLLALYASPKAKATLDILWEAAGAMVREESEAERDASHPGDINQALIELGSTVCKVRDPSCESCPLRPWCSAYALAREQARSEPSPPDIEDLCTLCEPMTSRPEVIAFPMKADRKKAREELDIMNVVEWRSDKSSDERFFFLVKRPETGLLAGLFDFMTSVNVSKNISGQAVRELSLELLGEYFGQLFHEPTRLPSGMASGSDIRELRVVKISIAGDVSHVFSHIKKTYRVVWVLMAGGSQAPELNRDFQSQTPPKQPLRRRGNRSAPEGKLQKGPSPSTDSLWAPLNEVTNTNMGTGSVKVWNLAKRFWEKGVDRI